MKKHINKIAAIAMVAVLIIGLSVLGGGEKQMAYAKTAQISLIIPKSVKKEMEFKVTVQLESNVDLYSLDAYLSYNPELLEFVPEDVRVTGSDGILELKDSFGEMTKTANYEITFRALQTGQTEILLTDAYLIDYEDMDYIEVVSSAKSFEIGINKKEEQDARLSDLIVAPGELTEVFSPEHTEYEMYVGNDVEIVGISAVPMEEESVVDLDMPDKLAVGENEILIIVTAPSGNECIYTVKVIRESVSGMTEIK